MTISELGECLSSMYRGAAPDEAVVMIHLFGIKYAEAIRASGASAKTLAIAAGISESYGTEINKGVNLARYVAIKN